MKLHDQIGSTFRQTFGGHNLGQVILRELDNLVAGWAWFSAFGRRPTPLYKIPPVLRDRRFIRSLWRHAFHDGENDLFIAREMVIGEVACENLPDVPVNHRPAEVVHRVPAT